MPTSIRSCMPALSSLRPEPCALCASANVIACAGAEGFFHCAECDVRYLHHALRLPSAEEESRYRTHNNDPADAGYRAFLKPLADALAPILPAQAHGLDFGCGPGPLLAQMFTEHGCVMETFDPVFQPRAPGPGEAFDFITLSEVAEHMFEPLADFRRLASWLRPGGHLGVMTALTDTVDFATWYYRRDPTHVVFYSRRSFEWLAQSLGFSAPSFCSERVILLQKPL